MKLLLGSGWRVKTLFTSFLFLAPLPKPYPLSHRESEAVQLIPAPGRAHLMRLTGLEHSDSQTCASDAHARYGVPLIGNTSETAVSNMARDFPRKPMMAVLNHRIKAD